MKRTAFSFLLPLIALPFAGTGCSKPAPQTPAAIAPGKPIATAPSPVAPFRCETAEIAARWKELGERERARPALDESTKASPSAANFRALLDFDRAYAELAERSAVQLATCPGVPAADLATLRKNAEAARSSVLHLSESLPSANP